MKKTVDNYITKKHINKNPANNLVTVIIIRTFTSNKNNINMSRLISELPYEIKIKAMIYSNVPDEDNLSSAFIWDKTNEGWDVWNEIYYKDNYQLFYDHYNIKPLTPKQWCKEKGYNEYHVMIIEQYLNDIGK